MELHRSGEINLLIRTRNYRGLMTPVAELSWDPLAGSGIASVISQ